MNAIAPGIVDAPMHQPADHESQKSLHPIPRLATVQEIVEAALFLVGASFITGEVLYVDGGAHAGKWSSSGFLTVRARSASSRIPHTSRSVPVSSQEPWTG